MTRTSIKLAEKMQSYGLIDPLSNLNQSPVFIFSGRQDEKYPFEYQISLRDYYLNFGSNVKYVPYDVKHEWPAIY